MRKPRRALQLVVAAGATAAIATGLAVAACAPLPDEPPPTSPTVVVDNATSIADIARAQLGTPIVRSAAGPDGYDTAG